MLLSSVGNTFICLDYTQDICENILSLYVKFQIKNVKKKHIYTHTHTHSEWKAQASVFTSGRMLCFLLKNSLMAN